MIALTALPWLLLGCEGIPDDRYEAAFCDVALGAKEMIEQGADDEAYAALDAASDMPLFEEVNVRTLPLLIDIPHRAGDQDRACAGYRTLSCVLSFEAGELLGVEAPRGDEPLQACIRHRTAAFPNRFDADLPLAGTLALARTIARGRHACFGSSREDAAGPDYVYDVRDGRLEERVAR